jgi:hypothetical protein
MAPDEAPGKPPRTSVFARLKRGLFMTHTELLAKVGGAIRATFEPGPAAGVTEAMDSICAESDTTR